MQPKDHIKWPQWPSGKPMGGHTTRSTCESTRTRNNYQENQFKISFARNLNFKYSTAHRLREGHVEWGKWYFEYYNLQVQIQNYFLPCYLKAPRMCFLIFEEELCTYRLAKLININKS